MSDLWAGRLRSGWSYVGLGNSGGGGADAFITDWAPKGSGRAAPTTRAPRVCLPESCEAQAMSTCNSPYKKCLRARVAVGCCRCNSKSAGWRERRENPGQGDVGSFRLESLAVVGEVVDVGAAVGSGLDQRAAELGPGGFGQVDVGDG